MDHPYSPGGIPTFQAAGLGTSHTYRMHFTGGTHTLSVFQQCAENQFLVRMKKSGELKYHYRLYGATNKEFMNMIRLYQGPNAIIVIGDDADAEKWEIPKKLLCHYSDYFNDALLPSINDDDKHTLYFEGRIRDAFCVVVRLMYTGVVNFDKAPTPGAAITQYLDFFHLGERLDIEWVRTKIDIIANLVERILEKHKNALTSAHIRSTFDLPAEHPMRFFIAELCYKQFLVSDSFKFWKEWTEIPDFWSTVLLASKQVVFDTGFMTKKFEKVGLEDSVNEDEKVKGGAEDVDMGIKYIKKEVKEELGGNHMSFRDLNALITKELEEEKENLAKMRMDGQ